MNRIEVLPLSLESKKVIAGRLAQGEIAIFPTETSYAIGCIATDENAVEKIYQLKGRRSESPLLVLVNRMEMLKNYFQPLTPLEKKLIDQYWPGPLTMVLRPKQNLAKNLNFHTNTIAVRMTQNQFTQELIEVAGVPLVGTSANPSGKKAAATIEEAQDYFGGQVGLFLDGGKTKGGLPTTLIEVQNEEVQILRQGELQL